MHRFLLLCLVASLAGCEAKAKPAEKPAAAAPAATDDCARAVDHGTRLIEDQLRSKLPFGDEMCETASPEQLRCYQDARTSDDVLACARAALTGTITVRAGGSELTAEQRAACTAADDNWLRINLATIAGARAGQISLCQTEDAATVRCKLDATDPAAWMACSSK